MNKEKIMSVIGMVLGIVGVVFLLLSFSQESSIRFLQIGLAGIGVSNILMFVNYMSKKKK